MMLQYRTISWSGNLRNTKKCIGGWKYILTGLSRRFATNNCGLHRLWWLGEHCHRKLNNCKDFVKSFANELNAISEQIADRTEGKYCSRVGGQFVRHYKHFVEHAQVSKFCSSNFDSLAFSRFYWLNCSRRCFTEQTIRLQLDFHSI